MAQQKYRYRKIEPDIDLVQLQKEVDSTVTIDETHSGQIQNVSVDDADANNLVDLDDAMAQRGYSRIGGSGQTAYPAEDDELSGWKETVLHIDQLLAGAAGGILQGILGDIAVNPADGDTFIIDDGVTTETFTFKAAPAVAFDVQIGASADATETNLISQINTDSTLWSAVGATNLGAYFSGAPSTQFVIHRTATSLADDRVYGVIAGGQAGIQIIEFNSSELQEYTSAAGVQGNLPAADPAVKTFGMGRLVGTLRTNETHWVTESIQPYTWDEANQTWISTISSDGSDQMMFGADGVATSTTDRFLYPGYAERIAQTTAVAIRTTRAGTIRNLRVRVNAVSTSANNIVYTVRKNGAAQALTVTLAANVADGSDLVNSFTVAAGDLIDVIVTKGAATSPSPRDITATMEFTI
jgi:hypothetical protein